MTPELNRIYMGDCLEVMRSWPAAFVQTVVTSPPYWGLRDYGMPGQIGFERTPEEFLRKMVEVFREVRRIIRDDGTLWLNLGDSYTSGGRNTHGTRIGYKQESNIGSMAMQYVRPELQAGLKPKNLVGIPWRVALALQADDWYLRSDIIWAKPNPMPESVTDRPTKSHEYIFLLSKSERYFYDAAAIKEPALYFGDNGVDDSGYKNAGNYDRKNSYKVPAGWMTGKDSHTSLLGRHSQNRKNLPETQANLGKFRDSQRKQSAIDYCSGAGRKDGDRHVSGGFPVKQSQHSGMRNKRSVWTVPTSPFPESHFATYPPALIKPCILAGSRPGDVVLDPFMGAGTTALVAAELGRNYLGTELNQDYISIAESRIAMEKAQEKMAI